MYCAQTKEEVLQARQNQSKISTLFDNKLEIIDDSELETRSYSNTIWNCTRTVVLGSQVTTICVDETCCFSGVCSTPCSFQVVGCPNLEGCLVSYPCEFETVTQEFTGQTKWWTFRTYHCGWFCPYMRSHVTVRHTWESSLPNANLATTYKYKLNGVTYTLSGTGSQFVSRSLTHLLGIIHVNDPDIYPNISHVSANSTGTADNGQSVTCNSSTTYSK